MLAALIAFLVIVAVAVFITVGLAVLGAVISRRYCEEGRR